MEADGDLIGGRGGDSGAAFGERDPIIGQAAPGHDAGLARKKARTGVLACEPRARQWR